MKKTPDNFFRFSSVFSVLSVALIFLFSLSVAAQSKTIVSVLAETTVETDTVKLGNIAQISGEAARAERLKAISLGYAPGIGATREIARGAIRLAIAAAGFAENEIALDAPPSILIRRASQTVSEQRLRETVEKALLQSLQSEGVRMQITRLDLPGAVEVPTGSLSVTANPAGVRNFFAPFSISLEIRVDSRVVRRLSANVTVEAFADILVAGRELAAGDKISEPDVKTENRRLEKPLSGYLRKISQLRGAVLLKSVAGGTPLTTEIATAGVVIKNGDPVRIEAVSGNLKIIIGGEARAAGKIGDRIAVKNSQSGAILQATVVDEGLVKVAF